VALAKSPQKPRGQKPCVSGSTRDQQNELYVLSEGFRPSDGRDLEITLLEIIRVTSTF